MVGFIENDRAPSRVPQVFTAAQCRNIPPVDAPISQQAVENFMTQAFRDSETNRYCFPDDFTSEQRLKSIAYVHVQVLHFWQPRRPTLYWLSPPGIPEEEEASLKIQSMAIVTPFDSRGNVQAPGKSNSLYDKFHFLGIPFRYGYRSLARLWNIEIAADQIHNAFAAANGPHWRVDFVCTDPKLQGFHNLQQATYHTTPNPNLHVKVEV